MIMRQTHTRKTEPSKKGRLGNVTQHVDGTTATLLFTSAGDKNAIRLL